MRIAALVLTLAVIQLHLVYGYKRISLSRLCSTNHLKIVFDLLTDNKPEVQLDHGAQSAAIVHQHWNVSNVQKLPVCHFRVDARRLTSSIGSMLSNWDRGLYASVRKMKLRKKPSGECIDFVSFKRENGQSLSPRLCGEYESSGEYSADESKFVAEDSGVMFVHVELDTQRPLQTNEQLEVEFVLTAYERDCATNANNNSLLCAPNRCIRREFENDGIINCPPLSCADELKCAQQVPLFVTQPISGTQIAVSAITSLLLTMICVLCIYMCCKCKYDRHVPARASSSATAAGGGGGAMNRRGTNDGASAATADGEFQNIELPTRSSNSGRATAPDLDDKDLPPSYDSLFKKDTNVISV